METALEGSLCWGRFQKIEPGLEEPAAISPSAFAWWLS